MLFLCREGCCAEALGWREGCESVLNMGAPCNISVVALPAFIHPPFPPPPLYFLCFSLFLLMAFAGAHLVLTPSQPGGASLGQRVWVWVAQGAGSPCPHGAGRVPRAGTRGLGSSSTAAGQDRVQDRGAMPRDGQPGVCPTRSWQRMGWAARRYSCPAQISVYFPG